MGERIDVEVALEQQIPVDEIVRGNLIDEDGAE